MSYSFVMLQAFVNPVHGAARRHEAKAKPSGDGLGTRTG